MLGAFLCAERRIYEIGKQLIGRRMYMETRFMRAGVNAAQELHAMQVEAFRELMAK